MTMNWTTPYLTADLPGIGGIIRAQMEDFIVEEIPAYEPCGEGEHTFFRVRKRDISTPMLIKHIAAKLNIAPRDISSAGLKDARAITEQTLCIHNVPPEVLLDLKLDLAAPAATATILWAKRHTNKLRSGHLKGNRFTLRIRDVAPHAEQQADAILAQLTARGVPNGYGAQRFGTRGTNHEVGMLLLRNDRDGLKAHGIRHLSRQMRRFLISALQSALFNQVLAARITQGTMDSVVLGDVAKKTDTGGMFDVQDLPTEQARATAWEISATGPMYGYKMRAAHAVAGDIEAAILAAAGLTLDDFRPVRAKGSRRPLRYYPDGLTWHMEDATTLLISYFAPKGAFATMLLRELMKKTAHSPSSPNSKEHQHHNENA